MSWKLPEPAAPRRMPSPARPRKSSPIPIRTQKLIRRMERELARDNAVTDLKGLKNAME